MTHEVSPAGPEGGHHGLYWLEDAGEIHPVALAGVPVGDLSEEEL